MEKKEISAKTAVKGLVNGFLSYGLLILFIFFCIVVFIEWELEQYKDKVNYNVLKYSLPLIAAFIIFFLIRAICRLSTFDLFKKCKIKKADVEKVSVRMNLFFIGCVIFFVALIAVLLNVRFNNQKISIQQTSSSYYDLYDDSYADYLTLELIDDFQETRTSTLIQVIIIECGLLLGLFSLIPVQKKLINQYNYVSPSEKDNENKHTDNSKGKHAAESI